VKQTRSCDPDVLCENQLLGPLCPTCTSIKRILEGESLVTSSVLCLSCNWFCHLCFEEQDCYCNWL